MSSVIPACRYNGVFLHTTFNRTARFPILVSGCRGTATEATGAGDEDGGQRGGEEIEAPEGSQGCTYYGGGEVNTETKSDA